MHYELHHVISFQAISKLARIELNKTVYLLAIYLTLQSDKFDYNSCLILFQLKKKNTKMSLMDKVKLI